MAKKAKVTPKKQTKSTKTEPSVYTNQEDLNDEVVLDQVNAEKNDASSNTSPEDSEPEENEVDALRSQLASEKEAVLRAYAELENFKRRKEQEKASYIKFANEGIVLELLTVLDSFDMAMSQLPNESKGDDTHAIKQGIDLIYRQFQSLLTKYDVTKIEALDQPFDPEKHQAMSQEAVKGKDANIVVREMQFGYMMNTRVIRPAMVVVST